MPRRGCLTNWWPFKPFTCPHMPDGRGPSSYENWLRARHGEEVNHAFEVAFYTDARITGEESGAGLDLGPYELLNTVPTEEAFGLLRPHVILRYQDHSPAEPPLPDMTETDVSRYHGGTLTDELAAVLSLSLGIRLRPGGIIRHYWPVAGSLGSPRAESRANLPSLVVRGRAPVIPTILGPRGLNEAELLQTLPDLRPADAVALIRAARLYQDSIWISDSEPALAWVFMVSSVEVAANHWFQRELDPVETLRENKPELANKLSDKGSADLLASVADEFANTMKTTTKFIRFLIAHKPDPPAPRPHESGQHRWSQTALRESFSKVYDHRSRALHDGTPFPLPMCGVPFKHQEWEAPSEIPTGLATHVEGGTWVREDTPMMLHTFEYIVRNALLKWWASLTADGGQNLSG